MNSISTQTCPGCTQQHTLRVGKDGDKEVYAVWCTEKDTFYVLPPDELLAAAQRTDIPQDIRDVLLRARDLIIGCRGDRRNLQEHLQKAATAVNEREKLQAKVDVLTKERDTARESLKKRYEENTAFRESLKKAVEIKRRVSTITERLSDDLEHSQRYGTMDYSRAHERVRQIFEALDGDN